MSCDDLSTGTVSETETITLSSESDTQSEYSESSSTNKRHRSQTVGLKKAKRRNIDTTDDIVLEKALAVINQPNDEFDILGQFIASEMRQMSDLSIRNLVKSEIMQVLLKYNTHNSNQVLIATNTDVLSSGNGTSTEYIVLSESESELFH